MLFGPSALFAILHLLSVAIADDPTFTIADAEKYDVGEFGRTPEQKFETSTIPAYRLLKRQWDEEQCGNDDEYIFIGVRGSRLAHRGPTIFDRDGHQIWNTQGYDKVYNFKPQMYKGKQYLTWWHGIDTMGHGQGLVYMYDQNYQRFKTINAHGNFSADLHEFTITPQNTALLTVYDMRITDLEKWGGSANESYAWDCLFQEIDLETDELLFEWRASDHFGPDECYNPYRMAGGVGARAAWDWFHMNSVAKDHKGNYLISARYSSSLTYIDGKTGEIIWKLGGKNNMFKDLSGGRATDIFGQHSATWQDNDQSILLYDNHGNNWNHSVPSRGLKLRVDQKAMTAEMIGEAYHPQGYITQSQGSVQQLPNGNIFVGYGFAGAFTEYSSDGQQVICDWQYAPLHYGPTGGFTPGLIQSYRVYKFQWKGFPLQPPDVAFNESAFFVSWNGATEQRYWVLEGVDREDFDAASATGRRWRSASTLEWALVGETLRQGFESAIPVEENFDVYRLTALDKELKTLGMWVVRKNDTQEVVEEEGTMILRDVWGIEPIPLGPPSSSFQAGRRTYIFLCIILLALAYFLRIFRLKRSLTSLFSLPSNSRELKERIRSVKIFVFRLGIRILSAGKDMVSGNKNGQQVNRRRKEEGLGLLGEKREDEDMEQAAGGMVEKV